MKRKDTQPKEKTVVLLDYLAENFGVLLNVLRSGANIEDLHYLAPLKELAELKDEPEFQLDGGYVDWPKLNAYICRKYYISEATLWRAKKRLEREITIED